MLIVLVIFSSGNIVKLIFHNNPCQNCHTVAAFTHNDNSVSTKKAATGLISRGCIALLSIYIDRGHDPSMSAPKTFPGGYWPPFNTRFIGPTNVTNEQIHKKTDYLDRVDRSHYNVTVCSNRPLILMLRKQHLLYTTAETKTANKTCTTAIQ